jgi:hypothetical protein
LPARLRGFAALHNSAQRQISFGGHARGDPRSPGHHPTQRTGGPYLFRGKGGSDRQFDGLFGAAMNVDPEDGVLGVDCRVHGTTNVPVTDDSVLPSCIRMNAQLTTMAMAHYAMARADPFAD